MFNVVNMGEVAYILGLKLPVDRNRRILSLSQMSVDIMIARFSMRTSKKGLLPSKHSIHLFNQEKEETRAIPYAYPQIKVTR